MPSINSKYPKISKINNSPLSTNKKIKNSTLNIKKKSK
jgi:hypothetical protein